MDMTHISMNAATRAAESMTERLLGRDDIAMMDMDWQVGYCTNFAIGVLEDMGVIVGEIMRDRIKEAVIGKIASWDDGVFWEDDEDVDEDYESYGECVRNFNEALATDDPLRRIRELMEKAEEEG